MSWLQTEAAGYKTPWFIRKVMGEEKAVRGSTEPPWLCRQAAPLSSATDESRPRNESVEQ